LYLHFKKISQHHFFKFLTFLKKIVKNRSKIKFRSTTLCPCISNFCVRSTTFKIRSGTTLQGYSEKKCEKNGESQGWTKYSITLVHPAAGAAKSKNRQNFEHPKEKVGVEIRQIRQNFNTHFTRS